MRIRGAIAVALAAFLSLPASMAAADTYPNRSIRLVVGFAAGGPTDVQARIFADALQGQIGQSVVIENRPGAGGNIAADAVSKADPDGYTLLYSSNALAISPAIFSNLQFDVQKDFAPVSELMAGPLLLAVHKSVPVKSVRELIDYARQNPGKINYASSGAGTIPHLAAAMFARDAKIQMQHVPYKGGAPAISDLVAGRVEFMMAPIGNVRQFIENGELRGLAVTGAQRLASLPDIPTVQEAGLPDFEASAWSGLFAPAKTPKPIIDRLYREISEALKRPDVQAKMRQQEVVARGTDPAAFSAYFAKDIDRWKSVVKDAGVKVD